MPKIVDHEQRRLEIMEATWKFIACHGFEKLNLRDLAASAGYANGALKPYFPTRNSILMATFKYVVDSTEARIARGTDGLQGLAAIRAFAHEVLPLDDALRDEARVVIHFWHVALEDPLMARQHASAMDEWRSKLELWLAQIPGIEPSRIILARDALMSYLLGTQISATLDHLGQSRTELLSQLEHLLDSLH